jgi:hypothetical protein
MWRVVDWSFFRGYQSVQENKLSKAWILKMMGLPFAQGEQGE